MRLSKCVSGVTAFGLTAFAAGVVGLSSPVFAACPVPHSLTNGQVADASEVMENFEAVAACADDVVELDGTAASGNIAVFSGTQTVTGGNLTGDITTSGTTATTLSATGVTPGMYPNATITVDAKGRVTAASVGSGGGSGGYAILDTKVADGSSGTITFGSIPQSFRDLIVIFTGQSVSATRNLVAYANGDSTNSNYRATMWNLWGNTNNSTPVIAVLPGAGVPSANTPSIGEIEFISYSNTSWKKMASAKFEYEDSSNFFMNVVNWRWNNTSAITQLTFQLSSGNFENGTIFTLYGRGVN